SITRAAKTFNVPMTTLRDRINGTTARQDKHANSHVLTETEEQTLLKWILDADKRGLPIRPEYLRGLASILLQGRTKEPTAQVGKNWVSRFINRRPEIESRYYRKISYQRANQEDPKIYREWFELVQETIAKYGITENDIWNFDETGFAMGLISTAKVVTSTDRSESRPRMIQRGNREWVTIIEAISSRGILLPPMVILTGKEQQAQWYQEELLDPTWSIAVSKNGWTTD
ncbi:hypothetical protein LIPSTDRAFT_31401, partial [Lipomyces starkeyi NRRL Y-11557]